MVRCRLPALLVALTVALAAYGAQRVEIFFDVPDGLAGYSGLQPVTFGVPFGRGVLKTQGDTVRVVDARGRAVPAQFDVTAVWGPGSRAARWLLVDVAARIENGKARPLFLEFGADVPAPVPSPARGPICAPMDGGVRVREAGLEMTLTPGGGDLGQFLLRDGKGRTYRPGGANGKVEMTLERNGPVRSVVKMSGRYVAADGASLAEFVTRVRFYRDCPFARVYHTMIWQTDDSARIGELTFLPGTPGAGARVTAGLDGRRVGPAPDLELNQTDWDRVSGSATGKRLDGWAQAEARGRTVFAALRWPWQQYPTAFHARDGRLSVKLIGPEKPMSLAWRDVAAPIVMPRRIHLKDPDFVVDGRRARWWDVYTADGKGRDGHISPRGVAKTYELLVWFSDQARDTAPEVKNALAQHPVLAFADPAFATRANLPSPLSPRDPKRFPRMEAALERSFDWLTREIAWEGDFGAWNFGDIQWIWAVTGYAHYRYWMNNGKGWPIVPWALWLRSGQRKYWEKGEANARHLMDVDTCHVPEWGGARDGKRRGAVYEYSAMHWSKGPQVAYFTADSEYLPYCYYMTGYERAWDVLRERAEALARVDRKPLMQRYAQDPLNCSRSLYVMVKELTVLHEATWDPRLKVYLDDCLRVALAAQRKAGWFPGITSNHYLDQSLNLAIRVDGPKRIVPALARWEAYRGDWRRPGSTGEMCGPASLWTLVTLAEHGKARRYLEQAAGLARARAWAVDGGDSAWRGMGPAPAHGAGPVLRDWTIVMAALAKLPPGKEPRGLAPAVLFHGRLPPPKRNPEGWAGRHAMLVLDARDEAFRVHLAFNGHNAGMLKTTTQRVRVFAPDGALVSDKMYPTLNTYYRTFGKLNLDVEAPADGKRGVYAIEVWTRPIALPVRAVSSTGKLMHYLPPGRRSVTSAHYGGRAWFQPAGGEEVVIGYPNGVPWARTTALDPSGAPVASSRLTGGPETRRPGGVVCRFRPDPAVKGLYSFTATSYDWHRRQDLRGLKPYVAANRDEWFDPTQHPCPDLKRLLDAPE